MRVTGFSLFSSLDEEPITFSVQDADPSAQYVVRQVLGLDANEIVPRYYGSGAVTKKKFYDVSLKAREIVMRIILKPRFQLDESFSDVRDVLYRLISRSRTGLITMHLQSGTTVVAQTEGSITKFEAIHFTQLPEVQITFRCPDGLFRAINPVVLTPSDLGVKSPVTIPDSISTAPHGFSTHIRFTSATATLTLQDAATSPDWKFKLVPSGGFLVNDILYLDRNLTNRISLDRGGVITYLADKIEPGSIMPVIFPGRNVIHAAELSAGNFLFDWIDFTYYPAYWGV